MKPLDGIISIINQSRFQACRRSKTVMLESIFSDSISELFSLAELNHVLSSGRLSAHDFLLFKNGRNLDVNNYTFKKYRDDADAIVDKSKLKSFVVDHKYSLKVFDIDQYSEAVFSFKKQLANWIGCRVTVNMYLTPDVEPCFLEHQDHYDVFVLQVEGEKQWYLSENSGQVPLDRQEASEAISHAEKKMVRKGDCLYVPSAVLHKAENLLSYPSLHLTVGIHSYTYEDYFEFLSKDARFRILFKQSLNPTLGEFDKRQVNKNIKEFLELLTSERNLEKNFEKFIKEKSNLLFPQDVPLDLDVKLMNRTSE